jgi:hypothetical protein
VEFSFFFLAASSLSFSFSFYFLGNPNPHIPPFVSSKKKILAKVDNLHLSKLDLFLHKTCLLAEFINCLRKIISLSYEIFFCWYLVLIGSRVRNPKVCIKWTSLTQDIQVRMPEGQNWQNARLIFKGCDFHILYFLFLFFLPYMYQNLWILSF